MARSSSQKGQYYKAKTKRWLEGQGYAVGHQERLMMVRGKPGLFVKRDQFGADLLAVSTEQVVFVQVKMGGASWRQRGLSTARIEFEKHPLPPGAAQWIVVWEPMARRPLVYSRANVAVGATGVTDWMSSEEGTT